MAVSLRETAFEPYRELQRHQDLNFADGGHYGAVASFVGVMRAFNEGQPVLKMVLEHYPGMTERRLEQIVETARARWNFIDALVIHRIGEINPGDPIVLVCVWSSHRGAAFDACRYITEELKSSAPLWKKETLPQGERWVEHNSDGY